jgi:hypothetical protein
MHALADTLSKIFKFCSQDNATVKIMPLDLPHTCRGRQGQLTSWPHPRGGGGFYFINLVYALNNLAVFTLDFESKILPWWWGIHF